MMTTAEQTVSAVLEQTNKRYVIETGSSEDGNSHFTLYSDGWLEQSGVILSGFSGHLTVPLMKAFRDKNYPVVVDREANGVDRDGYGDDSGVNYGDKSPTSFSVSLYGAVSCACVAWMAEGYSV